MRKIKFTPIFMILFTFCWFSFTYAGVDAEKLRVLVIEQNPVLESVGVTAAEELGQEDEIPLVAEEIIDDIEYGSNGIVDVEIVGWEVFDEFLTSKEKFRLADGSYSYTMDEATWFKYMGNGWRNYWVNKDVKKIGEYKYDYEHLIESFNLIERKNNDEFDQVWLVGVDPINPYETVMVGESAFWVNGEPIDAECENFIIMTLYVSRRDANFECYGHMAESVIRKVFGRTYNSYEKNSKIIYDKDDFNNLNLWERFCLSSYSTGRIVRIGRKYSFRTEWRR